MMGSAALLCVASLLEAAAGSYVMTDSTIKPAVDAWVSDATSAEATYGHISTWDTSGVTSMRSLFCSDSNYPTSCNTARASFNDDISAWDTSGVTDMHGMFRKCSSFNRDIGGWAVHSVTSMNFMFYKALAFDQDIGDWAVDSVTDMRSLFAGALAFDQDLGWCVDDDVDDQGLVLSRRLGWGPAPVCVDVVRHQASERS